MINLLDLVPNLITYQMNLKLTKPVCRCEIKPALKQMELDKALGPDGFTTRFVKLCWKVVKKYLHKMVLKSQYFLKIGGSTKLAFLALIPKEKGVNSFNRFRPIFLCNISYNIITKIIANKLRYIMPKLVPSKQGWFVKGRQIMDIIILVQKVIHSSIQWKENVMVV